MPSSPDLHAATSTTPPVAEHTSGAAVWRRWQPWVSTVLRLGLAVVALAAGFPKITDIPGSVRAVRAYEILPEALVPTMAIVLPMVEIILGVLLVLGLFTRFATVAFGALMVVFILGIGSAWARGLTIDCGCFGGGGAIDPDQTQYPLEILRDLAFLAAAVVLAWRPRSRLSLDQTLGLGH